MLGKRMSQPDKLQIDRFIEAAREFGCDENEAVFEAKLARIARQKPKVAAAKPGTE